MKPILTLIILNVFFISCSSAPNQLISNSADKYLCSIINDRDEIDYKNDFDQVFTSNLSEEKFIAFVNNIYQNYGKCRKSTLINKTHIEIVSSKDLKFKIGINEKNQKINGLWFEGLKTNKDGFNKISKTLCSYISPDPQIDYDELFHSSFKTVIKEKDLLKVFQSIHSNVGDCQSSTSETEDGSTGKFIINNKKKEKYSFNLNLATEEGKQKIAGLLFTGKVSKPVTINSQSQLYQLLKTQKGNFSLYLKKFNGKTLFDYKSKIRQPLGSIFKLYILQALKEKIEANNISWNKKIKIQEALKSLPSGTMQNLEDGTEVSLLELAINMISISDNTATDHLLNYVSKAAVEKLILNKKLNSFPEDNFPFLSTMDMFRTRAYLSKSDAKNYKLSNKSERIKILSTMPMESRKDVISKIGDWNSPRYIEEIEWFSSPRDICQLLQSIDINENKKIREILGKNTPFVNADKNSKIRYAGYKGGSEPGVVQMSYLLENNNGQKYCLYIGQSDSNNPIENSAFFELVKAIMKFFIETKI